MTLKRMWQTLMVTVLGGGRQTKWLKKHNVFHSMGVDCDFNFKLIPLYPELISFGDNVNIASGAHFLTHDGMNNLINKMKTDLPVRYKPSDRRCQEGLGCIKIGNNVSIASNVVINYGVCIGSNVIIAAGSVVDKDIPSNSVVRGIPAAYVCDFSQFARIRRLKEYYPDDIKPIMGKYVSPELIDYMWKEFNKEHAAVE